MAQEHEEHEPQDIVPMMTCAGIFPSRTFDVM
jgi:hypothetical protein